MKRSITVLAILILLVSLKGMQDLYPLNTSIPIIISGDDNGEDMPHIQSLMVHKTDNQSEVVLLEWYGREVLVHIEHLDLQL